jgi:hypothetical protein
MLLNFGTSWQLYDDRGLVYRDATSTRGFKAVDAIVDQLAKRI